MTDATTLDDHTVPTRFGLPANYRQRQQPEYFVDETDDGVTWQPDVYPYAAQLAQHLGRDTVVDIGCGRAGKLTALASAQSNWQFIGVDFGANIRWCAQHLTFGQSIEADLETTTDLAIPVDALRRAVVVCSDVLEHLVRPDVALALIHRLTVLGRNAPAVLSTPARERRAGADYLGEPRNPAHLREWTGDEFKSFLAASGFAIQDFQYTRSDDHGGGKTTQLVTTVPAPHLP
jgi:Methyltransferase domain